MSKHYVNNKDFYNEIVEWRKACKEAELLGTPKPRMPEYIGKCLLLISQRLSLKPNFIGYQYREEMISDGVENAILYFHNFDPEKTQNPFAYFTQIIYYAFLRRIQKERKQMYVKHKLFHQNVVDGAGSHTNSHDEGEIFASQESTDTDYINDFVLQFEAKVKRDKEKRKLNNLAEVFVEEETDVDPIGEIIDVLEELDNE